MKYLLMLSLFVPVAAQANNDVATSLLNLGQCILDLKSQKLFNEELRLGPGATPTTFSEFSKTEDNTILFHTPSATYKINLKGMCEVDDPKDGRTYYVVLRSMIEKSQNKEALEPSCSKVPELKSLFPDSTSTPGSKKKKK